MSETEAEPRLSTLAHGGGCGCKLAPNVLGEILGETRSAPVPAALLVDAATRDDAAVYKISDDVAVVATTDFFTPIIDDAFDFGRIAATNALSDVYAMGARPIFCLAIVGMPVDKISTRTMNDILAGGRSVAEEAGAPVAGGHSIDAAEPIYGLAALGLVDPRRMLTNAGARAGDVLILGKPLGVGVFSAAFKQNRLDQRGYDAMIASTTRLNRPGVDIAQLDGVHAMTDVTGFGLLGHLGEMCLGAGVSAHIERNSVPMLEGVVALAQAGVKTGASGRNWAAVSHLVAHDGAFADWERDLLCDPQTSGGLLVACAPSVAPAVLAAFEAQGHEGAAVIGRIEEGAPRVVVE